MEKGIKDWSCFVVLCRVPMWTCPKEVSMNSWVMFSLPLSLCQIKALGREEWVLLIPPTYGQAQQPKASSSCPLPAIQKGMGEVGHPSPVGSAMHALVPPLTHPSSISPLGTSPNPKDGSIAAFNESYDLYTKTRDRSSSSSINVHEQLE